MLGADRREAHNPHPVMLPQRRREICPAIDCHVMPHSCEPLSHFLVIGFDSTVFRNQTPSPDECDPQRPVVERRYRREEVGVRSRLRRHARNRGPGLSYPLCEARCSSRRRTCFGFYSFPNRPEVFLRSGHSLVDGNQAGIMCLRRVASSYFLLTGIAHLFGQVWTGAEKLNGLL